MERLITKRCKRKKKRLKKKRKATKKAQLKESHERRVKELSIPEMGKSLSWTGKNPDLV